MNEFIKNADENENIEVIEGLLRLTAIRELEIRELSLELERIKADFATLAATLEINPMGSKADDAAAEAVVEDPNELKVLIADPVNLMCENLANLLTRAGFRVIGKANTGMDTIKHFIRLRPNLLTLDIEMPDINGLQIIKRILNFDPTANIIVLTGGLDNHELKNVVKAGVCEIISKPVNSNRLIKAINRLIAVPADPA